MKKRILFVGGGEAMARAVVAAGRLGYQTIALDNTAQSPVIAAAQESVAGDIGDPQEVLRVAHNAGVDGIYPTVEPAVLSTAIAAAELNLPWLSAQCVELTRDKHALRQMLTSRGIPQPTFCPASTEQEANAAAATVRLPVIVKPSDGSDCVCVRRVDQIEDVSLAFLQARRESARGTVLIESVLEGRHLSIDGAIQCGSFRPILALGMIPSSGPACYTQAVYAPIEEEVLRDLIAAANSVASALKITSGILSAEFIKTSKAFFLLELHAYPAHLRLPFDLMTLTSGVDSVAGVLLACTGEAPGKGAYAPPAQSAAITWMPTHSGIVTDIVGQREARSMPGIVEVKVAARLGQTMGHVLDRASRDSVGYIVTSGRSAGEALDCGLRACEVCRVVTNPALG